MWWNKYYEDFDETQDIDPGKDYTSWQIEQLTNHYLKEDSKRETCQKCGSIGDETGVIEALPQADKDGNPITDDNEDVLYIDFPELECKNSHRWYKGEGKRKGIDGENPILFENHLQERRKREIYVEAGTPDPQFTMDRFGRPIQGIYNRVHPNGRKVNTEESRKKHGSSFYR